MLTEVAESKHLGLLSITVISDDVRDGDKAELEV